jgi:hypothetical protein
MRIPDVYAQLGASDGAGMLRVTGNVLSWARTYNQSSSGTFGSNIPSQLASHWDLGQTALFPIHTPANMNTEFRSNLAVIGLGTDVQNLTLTINGVSRTLPLQPGVYSQVSNVGAYVGANPGDATLSITSDGTWAGYVTSIDPLTNDPTTIMGGLVLAYPFYDPFDTFSGWTYAPASTPGASFRTSGGLLSVASYGPAVGGNGPVITKDLIRPIDLASQDFKLDTAIVTPGSDPVYVVITVELLDADGTPITGFRWDTDAMELFLLSEGTKKYDWNGAYQRLNGKLTVTKSGGNYSLSLNDGPAILSAPQTTTKVATTVRITFQRRFNSFDPAPVMLDWVRVTLL